MSVVLIDLGYGRRKVWNKECVADWGVYKFVVRKRKSGKGIEFKGVRKARAFEKGKPIIFVEIYVLAD